MPISASVKTEALLTVVADRSYQMQIIDSSRRSATSIYNFYLVNSISWYLWITDQIIPVTNL